MNTRRISSWIFSTLFLMGWIVISTGEISAQGDFGFGDTGFGDTGFGQSGGPVTQGDFNTGGNGNIDSFPQTTGGTTGDTGNLGTGSGGTGGIGGQSSPDITVGNLIGDLAAEIEPPPNERFLGFVGQTSDRLNETGFVGGYSEFIGPSSEGTYGGSGFNSAGGRASGGAGGGGGGNGTGQTENGFRVIRQQQIRARVVPNFSSPAVSPGQRASRFNRRMSRVPQLRRMSGNISVTMQGTTAIINGTAQNPQQLQIIERQLRLEPGVSRIVNQARNAF